MSNVINILLPLFAHILNYFTRIEVERGESFLNSEAGEKFLCELVP
jgi:hypothetical protein